MRDERGIIMSFVLRTIVVFILIGIVAYDAGQVVVAQVKAQDIATAAAQAGADAFFSTKRVDEARVAADAAAKEQDPLAVITDFQVDRNGSVTVTVEHTATTIVVSRISVLRHFGLQTATEQAVHTS